MEIDLKNNIFDIVRTNFQIHFQVAKHYFFFNSEKSYWFIMPRGIQNESSILKSWFCDLSLPYNTLRSSLYLSSTTHPNLHAKFQNNPFFIYTDLGQLGPLKPAFFSLDQKIYFTNIFYIG